MTLLRRISSRQLLALSAVVVVVMAGATALALAATGGGPKPAPAPLANAAHDALTAPEVPGVSARIQFTNHLIAGSAMQGTDPILSGASGRLWASPSGDVRLELQASGHEGATSDSQVLIHGNQFTIYDSGSNTLYKGTLPQGKGPGGPDGDNSDSRKPPSLAEVKKGIASLMEHANVGGATPSDLAGRPAYTVRISPKQNGGLIGGAALAWDAVNGTPLRAAVYAAGDSSPVLELKATDISYGSVPASVFDVTPPPGASVTDISPAKASQDSGTGKEPQPVTGFAAVQRQASFPVSAPATLAGRPQSEARLIQSGNEAGALVTYGNGLTGIAVIEQPVDPKQAAGTGVASGDQGQLQLPSVSVNGSPGQELDTPLGTVIRFQRGGVQYTVVGSVPPATALEAASAL